MTSSFPEQQYNPQALAGGFNPIEQIDVAPALRVEQERQMQQEQQRLQDMVANDKVRIQNAGQYGRDMQALGQLSETLANQLLEYQKKENEKAMQRGMMNAYTEGVPEQEQQDFDEKEAVLEQTNINAGKDAADAEANGASIFTGEKIRKMSGWEKYGYVKGRMQIHSQGFPLFVQQNADNPVTLPDGRTITLNTAKEPEEQAAALQYLLAQYIDPYKEYSPVMANKYLLKPLQGIMQQQMVLFAQRRGAEIKTEREAERLENFMTGIGTLEQKGSLQYVSPEGGMEEINYGEYGSKFIMDYPGTPAAARAELADILKTGLANDTISPETAKRILTDPITWNDGSTTTLLKKAGGVFGPINKLIEDAIISNNRRDNSLALIKREQRLKELLALARKDDGELSDAEVLQVARIYQNEFPDQPFPRDMDTLFTKEDADLEGQRQFLREIQERDGTIAPMYTVNVDPKVLAEDEFKEALSQGSIVETAAAAVKEPRERYLKGLLRKTQLMDEGGNFNGPDAATIYDNLEVRFGQIFTEKVNAGAGAREALAESKIQLQSEIGDVTSQDSYQQFKDPLQFIPAELAQQRVTIRKALQNGVNPGTEKVPGITQADLKSAEQFMRTGRGSLPAPFKFIAQGSRLSAAQIAANQLEAYGYEGFKVPEIETKIQESDNPYLRELLYTNNTPSRTLRASIEDPELVNVLDLIAGVESEGDGGYDAYNLGGYTADDPYGSGDSSKNNQFEKPISQMTVGEIMRLQKADKVHAVGRYQFIGITFKEVVEGLGLPKNTVFDQRTQDAMALYRLRWRINLQNSTTGLINEWAGLKRLSRAQLEQMLQDAQDVNDPYNAPELLLKGLN